MSINLNRPRFKLCYHVEVVEPDTVFLLTENSYRVFNGPVFKNLAPLLTGQYTLSELFIILNGIVLPGEIAYGVNQLAARGFIEEATENEDPKAAAFWQLLGADSATAGDKLQETRVRVSAVGQAKTEPLIGALQKLGVQVASDGTLHVVLTDDYLQEELAAINQQALGTNTPWLLVKLIGNIVWIGPLFEPGKSGCWACLSQRIGGNRQVESFIQRRTGQTSPLVTSRSAPDSSVQLAANLAATEIAKWIVQGSNKRLEGVLLTYNVLTSELQNHTLVRRPQCHACGNPQLLNGQQPKPVELKSHPKKFMADGGHRIMFPEETFARYQHHISPITGVVNSLVDVTGEVNGITYSYAAGHNFAMPRDEMSLLRQNLRGRSGGKGMTDIQAKVSALGEAMERFSGVYWGDGEITTRGSYKELIPCDAIHLRDVMMFSEKQYANRETWNAKLTTNFHLVPNILNEDQELDWSPLWSLTNKVFKYLPTSYCYYGHPELKYFFSPADANGCAAGNTMEEAILQGFLELVERDSVAIWWYNRIRRPAVDALSLGIPYFRTLLDYYQQHNRSLWLLDITADLGIPVFAAISGRVDKPVEDIIVGFGAHLDPKIAILRALTELNQLLPAVAFNKPDGSMRYFVDDEDTLTWLTQATMEKLPYLAPDEQARMKTATDYQNLSSNDLVTDINYCVRIAEEAGMETLVLDQTRPDVGMYVCRVVVPGLRHFWRRLGPGRLYDVPVKLGWLDKPIPEEELNPFSVFF